jgi:hypothetical protein
MDLDLENLKLSIKINSENKEIVFRFIDELLKKDKKILNNKKLDFETETRKYSNSKNDYFKNPDNIDNLRNGKTIKYEEKKIDENNRLNSVGSWGQFNSFFPIKASLRILANYINFHGKESINLESFVNLCLKEFRKNSYNKLRGFPSTVKDTAKGRFVWHFLTPAFEMGLIDLVESKLDYEGLPTSLLDWDQVNISLTQQGLLFAKLPNNIFDNISVEQVLTKEETEWLISYLKEVDQNGYKEYSILKGVYDFLAEGNDGKEDLFEWFRKNEVFTNYIKSWSRKAQRNDFDAFNDQINNISITYSSSKVALLRELGVIVNKRNDYKILRVFK